MSRASSLRRFLHTLKNFLSGSDELPALFARASSERAWIVTSRLTQRTAFGILSAKPTLQVVAKTEQDAMRLAMQEIQGTYPGYVISALNVAPEK